MARALLAAGAGKGTRISRLGSRQRAIAHRVLRRLAHRCAGHSDQHADDAERAGPHRADQRRPDPDRGAPLPFAVTTDGRSRLRCRDSSRPKPHALRLPEAPYLRSVWLDDVDGVAVGPVGRGSLGDGRRRRRAGRRSARSGRGGGGAPATTRSSSTPRVAPRLRRRWCTASGPWHASRRSWPPTSTCRAPTAPCPCCRPSGWAASRRRCRCLAPEALWCTRPARTSTSSSTSSSGTGHQHRRLAHARQARVGGQDARHRPRSPSRSPPGRPGTRTANRSRRICRAACSGCRRASRRTAPSRSTTRLPESKAGAAGRAVNGIERRVVDPETGAAVAAGEVGELQLRGGALMTGFYKVHRNAVFTPDGFYPTNDLVRIDADGYAFFVGPHQRHDQDQLRQRVASRGRGGAERTTGGGAGRRRRTAGSRARRDASPRRSFPPRAVARRRTICRSHCERRCPASRSRARSCSSPHDDIPRTPTGKVRVLELTDMIAGHLDPKLKPIGAATRRPTPTRSLA